MNDNKIKDFIFITIGVLLVSISVVYFFEPNNIAAGGISGLAIIINNFIPAIPVGALVLMMDSILFIIAFLVIGSKFGAKSLYASLTLSLSMWGLESFLPLSITNDLMLATVFGTIISALGLAIVFNTNASTGGTDIIAKILSKFGTINIGKALLMVDFLVTLLGAVTFGIEVGLYGLLAVLMNGVIIDKIIAGFNVCNEVTIISNKNLEISKYIINELERGCTFLKGVGGYTDKEVCVLYTILDRNEFIKLKRHISTIDKGAFITVGEVHEVTGEWFKSFEE